jgi:hypothetical protein
MKKITLLVASIFLVGSVANASEIINFSDDNYITATPFNENEPIQFTERGIDFFVFANGEFDFNTRPNDSQGDYYYKTAGRRSEEANRRPDNFGTLIEHDNFGRVRRVGNTFINYDFNDRVSRIGTVYMKYNRFALAQVGGLQIIYNRFGEIIDMFGSVKNARNYGFIHNNNYENHNQNHYDYNNQYNSSSNNNDYYYYKKDGTKAIITDKKDND